MKQNKQAFTLVELIVVIIIIAILGTIAFISLQGYSASSRDSVRISDVSNMKTSLELFHLNAGKYPLPDENVIVDYDGDILWYQGTFGSTVISQLSRSLSKIPKDPLTEKEYTFSTANNKNEFQILALLEGDLTLNTVSQTNAATVSVIPRVDGQYNGVFIKTAKYIVPTPSIISSEDIGPGLTLSDTNIKSQVITGGGNIPNIGNINSATGELNISLFVYTGTINSDSTDQQKIDAMKAIQGAYTGSELASSDIYKLILNTAENDLPALTDVILNNTSIAPQIIDTSCDGIASGDTKDFWSAGNVDAGLSCDSIKKTFTCENTIWKDGINLADTETYSFESCLVADDITAPTGGSFAINSNAVTTTTTNVTLNIICPTDAAGSTPIQVAYGNVTNPINWTTCTTSLSHTLTTGDGTKTVYMKFKDSVGNLTSEFTDSIKLDQTAPTGGSFKINNNASSTTTTSVTLNIICPTDAAGSIPIQVAYGNTTNPSNWTTCTTSISHTLTTGDGTKTVYMKFKDSVGNLTSDVTDSIIYTTTYKYCTQQNPYDTYGSGPTGEVCTTCIADSDATVLTIVNGLIANTSFNWGPPPATGIICISWGGGACNIGTTALRLGTWDSTIQNIKYSENLGGRLTCNIGYTSDSSGCYGTWANPQKVFKRYVCN